MPVPFDTIFRVTPTGLANVPADNAPRKVKPTPFKNALAGVTAVLQAKQVLSKRIYPGTAIAGTEIIAPLVFAM